LCGQQHPALWTFPFSTCDVLLQVQEDFGIGLGEVQRARAAERVATGTKDVAERTGKAIGAAASATVNSVQEFDQKMRISERAGNAVEAVRDSAVVQSTASALGKAGSSVKSATTKVLEQPAVANATDAMGTGIRKLGASLTMFTSKITGRSEPVNLDAGSKPAEEIPRGAPHSSSTETASTVRLSQGATAFTLQEP